MGAVSMSVCFMLVWVACLDARGYYTHTAATAKDKTGPKDSKATQTDNEVHKFSPADNSVETSPFLHPDPLDPIMSNMAEMDVNSQILVQLKEMNEQLAALRRTVSNLKYQGHTQYKYMRRVQAACDAVHGAGHNAAVAGGGEEQSNMIRTAALRMEPQNLSPAAAASAPLCPDTFEYNPETRSCYLFGSDRITWRMAREKCMIMGADLVTIETNREQRFITDKARDGSDIRHCDFWTGATDQDSEGHWYWVANNKPLTYSSWNHNEPNNGNGDEHCMHMLWVFGWSWNDARCNYDSACYICEIHRGKAVGGGRNRGWE